MRTWVRKGAAVAAAVVSAVALSACGSQENGPEPDGKRDSAAPSAGASQGGAGGVTLADAAGAWLGTTDGKPVTLTISTGGQTVVISDAHVCQGVAKEGETLTLTLSCKDGNTDRESGTVGSAEGGRLVVTWASGLTDTLSKPAVTGLPTNMPSIPSLPSLPPQP
ncbi:hypothetical protein [Streptomyces sp. SS162]|uniref:hypothetical protein n=1 Tax=Streptomyces sp. SS162 TaxID=3108484 RepID=UPI002F3EB659